MSTTLPVAHSDRAHSILGASSSNRWLNCPGSIALAGMLPEPPGDTKYTREGTVAHEIAELALREGVDPLMYVGKRIDGVTVTKEMALAVGMYTDKVNVLSKSVGVEPMIEVRFSLARLNPPVDMFGTADCVIPDRERSHLHVLDYKHGQGVVVEATDNPQLLTYALGAVLHLEERFDQITVWIVQPRAPHRDGVVREWTVSWDELVDFRHRLLAGAEACFEPDAPLKVGSWCRFCPASAICPAQMEHAVATVQDAFVADAAPALPEPETLSEEDLQVVLDNAEHLMDWLRRVQDFVRGQKEEGRVLVDSWKLIEKRANRRWTKTEEEIVQELADVGLTPEDLYESKLLSPARVEALLRREGHQIPEGLVEREVNGYNLVPASDPRPEAIPTLIADVFNAEAEASTN